MSRSRAGDPTCWRPERVLVPGDPGRDLGFDWRVSDAERLLLRFAEQHHGLYRTRDAYQLGLSFHHVRQRSASGLSERLGGGVHRVVGVAPNTRQELLAAVWRTDGVASHRSAAVLHGLLEAGDHDPEVTVAPTGGHEVAGVIVHRSGDLHRSHVEEIDAIPVTGVARTLVDLGAVVGRKRLEQAVHRARHLGLVDLDALRREYEQLSARGRNGCGPMGELLADQHASLAPTESRLELELFHLLRRAGVPLPERQHPVLVEGRRFVLDFAYPRSLLFLEGDGFGVHGTRSAFESDRDRQNLLVVAGWRPLRFTWRQVRQSPHVVVARVRGGLAGMEAGAPPAPGRRGRNGPRSGSGR